MPGERDNARNNARCTQVRKTTRSLDGQHKEGDRNVESIARPTLGSRTAKEQNRTT